MIIASYISYHDNECMQYNYHIIYDIITHLIMLKQYYHFIIYLDAIASINNLKLKVTSRSVLKERTTKKVVVNKKRNMCKGSDY